MNNYDVILDINDSVEIDMPLESNIVQELYKKELIINKELSNYICILLFFILFMFYKLYNCN